MNAEFNTGLEHLVCWTPPCIVSNLGFRWVIRLSFAETSEVRSVTMICWTFSRIVSCSFGKSFTDNWKRWLDHPINGILSLVLFDWLTLPTKRNIKNCLDETTWKNCRKLMYSFVSCFVSSSKRDIAKKPHYSHLCYRNERWRMLNQNGPQ